jgi:hypothetical protein
MSEVTQSTLEEQLKVVQSKFDQLEGQRQQEIEKGKVINRNIATIAEEMVRLQGEYRVLQSLKDDGQPKQDPQLTIPKKKGSKKR